MFILYLLRTMFAESGKCFGELALINENSIRNATIIADEDCVFMLIPRSLYNDTLKVCNTLQSLSHYEDSTLWVMIFDTQIKL